MSFEIKLQKTQLTMNPIHSGQVFRSSIATAFLCSLPFPGNIHELVNADQLSSVH